MEAKILGYSQDDLKNLSIDILNQSKKYGAEQAELDISLSSGKTISVRNQETETIESNNDKNLTLTLFKDKKRSIVSSSDFSKKTIENLVEKSISMLSSTESDEHFGLADKKFHPKCEKNVDIFYPQDLSFEEIIDLAKEAEISALDFDPLISNSEGASFSESSSTFVYANSNGFIGGFPGTRFSLSCSVIAGKDGSMQRSYDYSNARDFKDLKDRASVGIQAARNARDRLNPSKIKTGNYPVIFHNTISDVLISSLLSAISGRNLYRQNSFLMESLGKKIASDKLNIIEDPFLSKGHASTYFDDEGVEVFENKLINKGILEHYLLSSYSGRKLNLKTTGNAGGTHNLIIDHHNISLDDMISQIESGLLITELLGHGINMVNGDFSRGASGFYIKNGKVHHSVEEISIAGNMKQILLDIEMIANDININSSKYIGSVLIKNLSVGS